MGTLQALAYADGVVDGWLDLDQALSMHLQSNHYPPVHPIFMGVAREAIEVAVDAYFDGDEDYAALDEVVTMPNGIDKSYGDILDELHLGVFVDAAIEARRQQEDED